LKPPRLCDSQTSLPRGRAAFAKGWRNRPMDGSLVAPSLRNGAGHRCQTIITHRGRHNRKRSEPPMFLDCTHNAGGDGALSLLVRRWCIFLPDPLQTRGRTGFQEVFRGRDPILHARITSCVGQDAWTRAVNTIVSHATLFSCRIRSFCCTTRPEGVLVAVFVWSESKCSRRVTVNLRFLLETL
jgi:hypothetical protein